METIKCKYLLLLMKNYSRCHCEFIKERGIWESGIYSDELFILKRASLIAEQKEYKREIQSLYDDIDESMKTYVIDIVEKDFIKGGLLNELR